MERAVARPLPRTGRRQPAKLHRRQQRRGRRRRRQGPLSLRRPLLPTSPPRSRLSTPAKPLTQGVRRPDETSLRAQRAHVPGEEGDVRASGESALGRGRGCGSLRRERGSVRGLVLEGAARIKGMPCQGGGRGRGRGASLVPRPSLGGGVSRVPERNTRVEACKGALVSTYPVYSRATCRGKRSEGEKSRQD